MEAREERGQTGESSANSTKVDAGYSKPKVEKLQKLADVTGVAKMTGNEEEV